MELATESENVKSQQVNAKYLDICRNTNNTAKCAEINALWNGLANVEQAEWIWNHKGPPAFFPKCIFFEVF